MGHSTHHLLVFISDPGILLSPPAFQSGNESILSLVGTQLLRQYDLVVEYLVVVGYVGEALVRTVLPRHLVEFIEGGHVRLVGKVGAGLFGDDALQPLQVALVEVFLVSGGGQAVVGGAIVVESLLHIRRIL